MRRNMILELDVGNTRTKWRLVSDAPGETVSEVLRRGVMLSKSWSEMDAIFSDEMDEIRSVRFASVANNGLLEFLKKHNKFSQCDIQEAVSKDQCAGVKNSYQHPERLGVDRWLAMLAAYNTKRSACCVIDCGSAVTVDYVNADGVHQGGFIVAGMQMLENVLLQGTSKVLMHEELNETDTAWGINTEQAVQHGKLSMLSAWLNKLAGDCRQQGADIYMTGGDAHQLKMFMDDDVTLVEDLVLDGLRYACAVDHKQK